ncbi:DUF2785 domain-containing protein [Lacticaseibacillus sp. GG6-2]
MDEFTKIYQAIQTLHAGLVSGKRFASLPQAFASLMINRPVAPAKPVIVPSDDAAALEQIKLIVTRVKQADAPTVTDDELSFLVDHLASLNPLVRDKGVFFCLSDLLQASVLTNQQLSWLFKRLQAPDVLYAHILEPTNDAVFLRSFAVMILSTIVYVDRSHYHVLTAKDYADLVVPLATYIALEQDGRGYVDGKGWAHAYTHIGNLLDELSQINTLKRAEKVFLLIAVLNGWQQMNVALVFGEDQRIALYLTNLASKHQFYAQSLVMCFTQWQKALQELRPVESEAFWNRWYNRSRLLEACIMRADMPQTVVDYLQKIIDMY